MPYTQTTAAPQTSNSSSTTDAPTRTAPDAKGYDAQKRQLKPKTADGKTPKFEMFALTDAQKALFVELRGANKTRTEAIMKQLTKTEKVPKTVIEAVIEANKPWYGTTWDAIKGGSWHTVGTDDKGNITHEFKLDGKGLGWENVGHKVVLDVKKQAATYENKKGEWGVTAGYKDRGTVDVHTGNKKDGLSEYHVEGGKDGGGASYSHTKGKDKQTYSGGVTLKDKGGTAKGSYVSTTAKTRTAADGEVSWKEGGGTAKGGYHHKDESGSLDATGEVSLKKNGGGAKGSLVKKTKDGVTRTYKGAYDKTDKVHTATGGYTVKDKKGTTSYDGKVVAGGKSQELRGGYNHSEKGKKTQVTGGLSYGEKTGLDLHTDVDREGYTLKTNVDASSTKKDGNQTDEAGGDATLTLKGDKGTKEKPKEGKPVTINVKVRGKKTQTKGGGNTTNVSVSGGVKAGNTKGNVSYAGESGNAGGGYQVGLFKADFGQKWDLDKKTAETFSLGLSGNLRLSDKSGEQDTYSGTLNGIWTKGKKASDKQELSFSLGGGHDKLNMFKKFTYATDDMLGGDKGYGDYASLGLGYKSGLHQLKLDGAYGKTDQTTLYGGHAGYKYGKKHEADIFASVAKHDSEVSTYLKLTSKFTLSKSLTLSNGGSYTLKTGTREHQELWNIHTSLGINLKKDMDLTLKMGVAGDGKNVYYVPEVMYTWKDKVGVGALGAVNGKGDYGVGAKVTVPKANLSIIGGYGNMNMLTNPYQGNAGMNLRPGTGPEYMGSGSRQGGFIGVQWNALPTLKKLFGGK